MDVAIVSGDKRLSWSDVIGREILRFEDHGTPANRRIMAFLDL